MQNWNLNVQHQVSASTVASVAYAGSKGTHLQRRYDINQPGREQALRSVRPYAGFGTINVIADGSKLTLASNPLNAEPACVTRSSTSNSAPSATV